MYVQLEGKQVRAPGSPAGVRTWRASRCAHLEAQQGHAPGGPAGAHNLEARQVYTVAGPLAGMVTRVFH